MGTKRLNKFGANRPSRVQSDWVRNALGITRLVTIKI